MAKPRPTPKIIRGDGIPPLPSDFVVANPDFRDLWEIAVGLSQLKEEEREARVAEVIDPESLTAFVSTFGIQEIGMLIHSKDTTPIEAASQVASTNLLMILVGIHYCLQHTWTMPEFTVPDHIEE